MFWGASPESSRKATDAFKRFVFMIRVEKGTPDKILRTFA